MKKYTAFKYAHRGLHKDGVAENSMTAFRLAVEGGFAIELDIRLSKDERLVVFHDATLDRVTGVSGKVSDYTYDELAKMKLLGTEDSIPLFSDVLSLVDGRVPLLVELKEEAGSLLVTERALELLESYKGEFIIESFN
ncbi:MAG: glycerophosphodiester phosphodiesterase, partial [Clostridia bacterium]|nr:glycerophosphodiester phosphodiesterase [Clostridia bacterium]